MSKQVQLRRGTATQHTTFTGAVGEVTMDTTANTLRVHDGQTVGGVALARQSALDAADYVIETQLPTSANGYKWYRKYKSGWIEQGGQSRAGASIDGQTTNLVVPLVNNEYNISATVVNPAINACPKAITVTNKTNSSFTVVGMYANANVVNYGSYIFDWVARGKYATGN